MAGPESQYRTSVELRISCEGLINKDVLSKSDPTCVVKQRRKTSGRDGFGKIGQTETIEDNLDPKFARAIILDYFFEEVQTLQFLVYDVDNSKVDVEKGGGELLGRTEATLGTIVSNGTLKQSLKQPNGADGGHITIHSEEVSAVISKITMNWRAAHLDKKDFFGKSDPYLEFSRSNPDGSFAVVHRTEVVKNTLDPSWRIFTIDSRNLCNSDPQRPIKITCFDWDSDGGHDLIGSCTTTLQKLLEEPKPFGLECINEKKKAKKKNYVNSGVLYLDTCMSEQLYTFLDYIYGGCQINFSVGIDFTGSNGDPAQPSSLHYMHTDQLNEYAQALYAVGNVCQQYDSDKLFPAFGFGAKIPPNGQVSHCFPLTFNWENPYVPGIDGILYEYKRCLSQISLWGPTNAAPIINQTSELAKRDTSGTNYHVLLLLTDGCLTDMPQTKKAIVEASRLPVSLIIVGVGGADFGDMNVLDADDSVLVAGGVAAERDIVQFVPFREFKMASPEALASTVLAEVPQQVVEYMRKKKIIPKSRQQLQQELTPTS